MKNKIIFVMVIMFFVSITTFGQIYHFCNIDPPEISIGITNDTTVCEGNTVSLSASGGVEYSWSTGETASEIMVTPLLTTTYTVTVKDENNCIETEEVIVMVASIPLANAGADQIILLGEDAVLTATGGNTYLWNTNDSTATITVSPSITTTYIVTVNLSDCTASDETVVNIRMPKKSTYFCNIDVPEISIGITNDTTVCEGNAINLSASGGVEYSWGTGETASEIMVTPLLTTTYTVTVKDENNCTDIGTVVITINPKPTITIIPTTTVICLGSSATLTASGGVEYSWSTGETASEIMVTPLLTTTYTVTVKDENNCTDIGTVVITINPTPTITIIPTTTVICLGSSATLTASGGVEYSWSTGETASEIMVTPLLTTTYTVTVKDENNCTDIGTVVITINPTPTITIIPTTTVICLGSSATLTASGGVEYSWSTGETASEIMVTPLLTTTYTVTVKDENNCTDIGTVVITINPTPTITIIPTTTVICLGSSATLTASGGVEYSWSTGETASEIMITPLLTTTYTVTVKDENNCTDIGTVVITINPKPTIKIIPTTTVICLGSSATLTASGGVSYSWSTGETFINIDVSPTTQTTYRVTGTDSEGCTGIDSVIVFINSIYSIKLSHESASICKGDNIFLSVGNNINKVSFKNEDERNEFKVPFNYQPTSFTVEFWVYPLNLWTYSHTIGGNWGNWVFHTQENGGVFCGTNVSSRFTPTQVPLLPSGTIEALKWQHFAYTYDSINADSGLCNFYKNSVLLATRKMYKANAIDTFRIRSNVKGFVDEIRFWTVARTQQEIEDNMYVLLKGDEENLLAYWNFEDSTGNDLTNNNYDGILSDVFSSWSSVVPTNDKVLWSNGDSSSLIKVSPLVDTKYKVTITDQYAECYRIDSITINVLDLPNISAGDDKTICESNETFIKASGGGTDVTYSWYNSSGEEFLSNDSIYVIFPTITTTYILEGSDGMCVDIDTVIVNLMPLVSIDEINISDTIICKGDSVLISTDGNSNSMRFYAGASDNVRISNASKLQITGNNTIEMWIKPLEISGTRFIYEKARGGEGRISLLTTGHLLYNYGTSGSGSTPYQNFLSKTSLSISEWTHVAIVRDTVNMKLYWYINGDLDNQTTASYSMATKSNFDVTLGSYFNGYIDEVRVWNRVLSGDEIKSNMIKQISANEQTGLVAYWRMNEYGGSLVNDYSGNDLDGTMFNNVIRQSDLPFNYEYLWSNGGGSNYIKVSPIEATKYYITVSNGVCYVKDSVFVDIVETIANAGIDKTICMGDEVTIIGTGGTSYNWNIGVSNDTIIVSPTETTTYMLTLTDNGCTDSDYVVVTVNSAIANAGENKTICEGNNVTIIGIGGSTYSWNNGETHDTINVSLTETTTYILTVTNNGCTDTDDMVVTVNPIPSANAGADSLICKGSFINIIATGGASYSWNTGATTQTVSISPEVETTYMVTVTNNGCTDSDAVIVKVKDLHIVQNDTVVYIGDSIFITLNSLENRYSLEISDDNSLLLGVIKIPINYNGNIFSVEWWAYPYSLTSYNVLGQSWGAFVAHNNIDGAMYVGTNTSTRFSPADLPSGTIEVDKWQHFAFTFNNGIAKFYKNGTLLVSKTDMANPTGSIDTIYINNFTGLFDEFKFWNKELNQVDIQNYMYKKNDISEANLLSYMTFDNKNLADYVGRNDAITSTNLFYNKDIPSNVSCLWSTGETSARIKVKPIANTTYTVTINECSGLTDNIIVSLQNKVSVTNNQIIKLGESVVLTASNAISYSWSTGSTSNSINVSSTGNTKYYVTGYNNGLSSIDSVEVFVYSDIKDTTIKVGDTISLGSSLNKQSLDLRIENGFSRLIIPNNSAFQITGDMTIEMWVYNYGNVDFEQRYILMKNRNAEGEILINKNNFLIYRYGNGKVFQQIVSKSNIETDKWVHIAIIRSLSTGKLYWYINGELDSEFDANYSVAATSTNSIYIGNVHNIDGQSNQINGLLDEFRIWKKALSQGEIKQVMNNKLTELENANTVLNIDFDNVKGIIVYDASSTQQDAILLWNASLSNKSSSQLSYLWNTGATSSFINVSPTETTTYRLTLSNGNVTKTESVVVTVYQNNLTVSPNKIIQSGTSVELTASGTSTYSWSTGSTSNSINVSPTGNIKYYVTGYTGGLYFVDSVEVFVYSDIKDTTIKVGDTISLGSSLNKQSLDLRIENGFSRLIIPNNSAFQITGDMTIEMWVYNYGNVDFEQRYILMKNRNAEGEILINKNNFLIYRYGNGTVFQQIVSKSNIETDKWVHIAIIRSLSTGKLYWYINGELDSEFDANYSVAATSTNSIYIGNVHNIDGQSNQINGLLDEFRIWKKALSQGEIKQVMNNKLTELENANTVLNIDFDNVKGIIVYDASSTQQDAILLWNASLSNKSSSQLSYLWNTGATSSFINVSPTETTTYRLTLSNGNVTKTESVVVTVYQNNLTVSPNKIIQSGTSVELTASGTSTYSWSTGSTSNSINVSPTGNIKYYVTGYTGGLYFVDSVEVFVYSDIKDTTIKVGDTISLGSSLNKQSLDLRIENGFSRLIIPNNSAFQITGDMTIEMWVYNYGNVDFEQRYILMKNRNAEGEILINKNNFLIYRYGNGKVFQQIVSKSNIETDKWVHIAIIRSLSTGKLYWYINGELDSEFDANYSVAATSTNSIYIGNVHNIDGQSNQINGLLDEFRIWKKALSQGEIKQVMNNKLTELENANTVLNIDFDNVKGIIVYDSSPTQQNGTLIWEARLIDKHPSLLEYLWSTGQTTSYIEVSPISTTTYTLTMQNSSITQTQDVIVSVVSKKNNFQEPDNFSIKTKVQDKNIAPIINVYPNPNNGIFNVNLKQFELNTQLNLALYNVLGNKIYETIIKTGSHNDNFYIDISSELSRGVFIMHFSNLNFSERIRIVVE